MSTLPVAAQDSEKRPQKSSVFFLVVADTICLLLMLNQLTVSQATHRRGSVLQVNQELSSELRFVSLGFPPPLSSSYVLLIEYSSSKQPVTFVSLIRDPVTKPRYRL